MFAQAGIGVQMMCFVALHIKYTSSFSLCVIVSYGLSYIYPCSHHLTIIGVLGENPFLHETRNNPNNTEGFVDWIQDKLFNEYGVGYPCGEPPSLKGLEQTHDDCHENGQDCGQLRARVLVDKDIDLTTSPYLTSACLTCSGSRIHDMVILNCSYACNVLKNRVKFDVSSSAFELASNYVCM